MTVSSSIIKPFFLFSKLGNSLMNYFCAQDFDLEKNPGLGKSVEINYIEKIFHVTSELNALKAFDHIRKEHVPGIQNVYGHTNGP